MVKFVLTRETSRAESRLSVQNLGHRGDKKSESYFIFKFLG